MSLQYWYLFPIFVVVITVLVASVGHIYGFIAEGGGAALHETVNVAMFTVPGVLIGGQLGPRVQARVNPDKMKVLISWIFMGVARLGASSTVGTSSLLGAPAGPSGGGSS
ncbi:MAG: hypothetical protein JRE19_19955 [Deltaproteobacteria bacterium]|nr:hypothetical protein [Deltaproteobacteria bacterium]